MYRRVLKHRILPQLGDIYCDMFRRSDLEDWVNWCESQLTQAGHPVAQDTLASWRRVLTPLLKDMAIEHGVPDPTVRVRQARSSRRKVREIRTLSIEQIGALLEAARNLPNVRPRYAEIATLAFTGMRSGELWALHVEDLDDIEERGIHIHRSVSGGVVRSETKTGWERHAYAPQLIIDAIHEHRREMIRTQHRGLSSGLVFPSRAGTPRTGGSIRKALEAASSAAGIEQTVSPQVFRRSYNSRLVEASVDHHVVRSQMGHSSDDMTRHYFEGHLEAKQAAFERAFGRIAQGRE